MAFYFSRRKLRPVEESEASELNFVPYLDILMNLIIFMLLSMTGLAVFGILNVNAPNYGGATASASPEGAPK
ncbi:MAG TPA: biopolymer transporter ExbD, partial [Myxococcales bacterium]